ncbi:MAG: nitroreductase family protein [Bacteroidales bacterium]
MNIIEIIKKRKSSRTFNQVSLKPAEKRDLESFIIENSKGLENEVVDFRIIEKNNTNNQMKLDLGMIKGHNAYILGTSKSTVASRVNYGYLMEKVVLKATEMNMSTCWVGYFDYSYFNEVHIEDGFDIPSIVIVGYSEERQTFQEKFVRLTVNAPKRNSWDKLFFNYKLKTPLNPEYIKKYSDSLEMVRLAPSSGNTQPWRVFFDDTKNKFHFFKKLISKRYELRGLHDIDMGIAMSHFELTSLQNGLSGSWFKHAKENINSLDDLQYIMTWKCE